MTDEKAGYFECGCFISPVNERGVIYKGWPKVVIPHVEWYGSNVFDPAAAALYQYKRDKKKASTSAAGYDVGGILSAHPWKWTVHPADPAGGSVVMRGGAGGGGGGEAVSESVISPKDAEAYGKALRSAWGGYFDGPSWKPLTIEQINPMSVALVVVRASGVETVLREYFEQSDYDIGMSVVMGDTEPKYAGYLGDFLFNVSSCKAELIQDLFHAVDRGDLYVRVESRILKEYGDEFYFPAFKTTLTGGKVAISFNSTRRVSVSVRKNRSLKAIPRYPQDMMETAKRYAKEWRMKRYTSASFCQENLDFRTRLGEYSRRCEIAGVLDFVPYYTKDMRVVEPPVPSADWMRELHEWDKNVHGARVTQPLHPDDIAEAEAKAKAEADSFVHWSFDPASLTETPKSFTMDDMIAARKGIVEGASKATKAMSDLYKMLTETYRDTELIYYPGMWGTTPPTEPPTDREELLARKRRGPDNADFYNGDFFAEPKGKRAGRRAVRRGKKGKLGKAHN